jgi:hypothetical protein
MMDNEVEALLTELRSTPTDLARVIAALVITPRAILLVACGASARWEREIPDVWARTQRWLAQRQITVVVS